MRAIWVAMCVGVAVCGQVMGQADCEACETEACGSCVDAPLALDAPPRIEHAPFGAMVDLRWIDLAEAHAVAMGPDGAPRPPKLKKIKVAYLGVTTSTVASVGETLRVQLDLPKGVGLVVGYIDPEGPAAGAGIRQHDILFKLGDQLLINLHQLQTLVRMHEPGEEVQLTVVRAAKKQPIAVKLGEKEVVDGPRVDIVPWPPAPEGQRPIRMTIGNPTLADVLEGRRVMEDDDHRIELRATDRGLIVTIREHEGNDVIKGPLEEVLPRLWRDDPGLARKVMRLMRLPMHRPDWRRERGEEGRPERRDDGEGERGRGDRERGEYGEAEESHRQPRGDAGEGPAIEASVITFSDDEHTLHVVRRRGRTLLTARDGSGRLIFEGLVDTPGHIRKIPAPIRRKYLQMMKLPSEKFMRWRGDEEEEHEANDKEREERYEDEDEHGEDGDRGENNDDDDEEEDEAEKEKDGVAGDAHDEDG